jgi:hypothetical protein
MDIYQSECQHYLAGCVESHDQTRQVGKIHETVFKCEKLAFNVFRILHSSHTP